MTRQKFRIQGMHCVGCAMVVDEAVENLAGVKSASTNYARQIADIEFDEKKITEPQIIAAIETAGYKVVTSK